LYGATSRDAGVSWTPNYEVTDQQSFFSLNTLAVPNLGDYNMAASSGIATYPSCSDQRQTGGNADVRTPGTNTYTAGRGPETYTAKVVFSQSVTSNGDFTAVAKTPVSRTFTIHNTGTIQDSYNWTVTDQKNWVSGPVSGTTGVIQ